MIYWTFNLEYLQHPPTGGPPSGLCSLVVCKVYHNQSLVNIMSPRKNTNKSNKGNETIDMLMEIINNQKNIIINQNKIINDLNDKFDSNKILLENINSNINNQFKINNNKTFADITKKNIEQTIKKNLTNTINKTLITNNNNIDKTKTIILYNLKSIDDNYINRYNDEKNKINKIINILDIDNIKINKFHRIGKYIEGQHSRPLKLILETQLQKEEFIKNAYKLKNTDLNHIGISIEYSFEQLQEIKDLKQEAKNKSSSDTKYKVITLNNKFKIICCDNYE